MAKEPYPYPDDEFDELARGQAPRGNHRKPRSLFRRVFPWILVLVLIPVMAYAAVEILTTASVAQKQQAYDEQQAADAAEAEENGTEEPGEDGPEGDADTGEADGAVEPEPEPEEPPFEPDYSIEIHVKNAGGISGLAARGSQILLDDGYVSVEPMNNDYDFTPENSAVYYASEDLREQAEYVAELMNIDTIEESITWTSAPITVILTSTFE